MPYTTSPHPGFTVSDGRSVQKASEKPEAAPRTAAASAQLKIILWWEWAVYKLGRKQMVSDSALEKEQARMFSQMLKYWEPEFIYGILELSFS